MKFIKLETKRPPNGQFCVIKEKRGKKTYIFNSCLQTYYEDCGFGNHPNAVEWAAVPEHVLVNPSVWKSEYRGDELPACNCECLICTDRSKVVKYAYYHDGKFLGHRGVIAFLEI